MFLQFPVKTKGYYPEVQSYWEWFRSSVEQIEGMKGLPESFTEDDGKVTEHIPSEDDDLIAAEYNYYWKSQELIFEDSLQKINIHTSAGAYGNLFTFLYTRNENNMVKLLVATNGECCLTLADHHTNEVSWCRAFQMLKQERGIQTIQIRPPKTIDFTLLQRCWRVFRPLLMECYHLDALPETIEENEGVIKEHLLLSPGDPGYDDKDLSKNQYWRYQAITFLQNGIRIELKDYRQGDSDSFWILYGPENAEIHPPLQIFFSSQSALIQIALSNPFLDRWADAFKSLENVRD